MQHHRAQGDTVVLSTATNRVITELTAAHLGIAHLIATDFEIDTQGLLTGRFEGTHSMREDKVTRLQT